MIALSTGAVFQFRKGSEVLLARAGGAKGEKVLAVGEDGKKIELPRDRVLQAAGELAGSPTDIEVRHHLRAVRAAAEALTAAVDMRLLWEMVREQPEGAPVDELVALYHGRSGSHAERLALGFALCQDRVYFRQKGDRFTPRMESEVLAALERQESERRAALRRKMFLAWITEALAHRPEMGPPPAAPEGAESELAAIEDLALRGEEAPHGARARTVMKAIAAEAPAAGRYALSADGAFDLLVKLGVFHEHENIPLRRAGLPVRFSDPLLAAAAAFPLYAFDPVTEPGRRDLRALAVVAIDDLETLDRDDAVSVEPLEGGRFRLGVHIADVAHLIPIGSPLDEEAARRGTTVYLPRQKLPMFPTTLSEGRLSLDAGSDRPALSFLFTLAPDLSIESSEIARTVVHVARNCTYEEVDRAVEDTTSPLAWLATARAAGELLARERNDRGALQLNGPELRVVVDERDEVSIKRIETRSPARELVAELMILANVTAARFCSERGIPAIYRRQPAPAEPLPKREDAVSPELWAFEVKRKLTRTEILSMPGPHFSLALEAYLQVTSPIRRFQDLVVERQIAAALEGRPLPYTPDDAVRLAAAAEMAGGEAGSIERERVSYWLHRWLEKRRGTPEEAICMLERDGKFLVELVETGLRGFVRPPRQGPRWRLGDRVKVRVDGVNARRGEMMLTGVAEKAPVEQEKTEVEASPEV